MNKLLIITGPTATGKTALGLELAKKLNGEIVSADSRQVYKYMDIGTGKDLPKFSIFNFQFSNRNLNYGFYEINEMKVWGLDMVEPNYPFNVTEWVDYANIVIKDIWERNKLPIVVGGSGQYIRSLIKPPETLGVPRDVNLRKTLQNYALVRLQQELAMVDKYKWEAMNKSDRMNPRRLIRAIEVAQQMKNENFKMNNLDVNLKIDQILTIGLMASNDVLYPKIDNRVGQRLSQGILDEILELLAKGYDWSLASMNSLGYKEFKDGISNSSGLLNTDATVLAQIIQRWKFDEHAYAKRQLTYLKKYFPDAHWLDISKRDYIQSAWQLVTEWI